MIATSTDSSKFIPPQAVRASYHPTDAVLRPFGPAPSLLSADFLDRLADRADRGLEEIYDPALAYVLSVMSGWAYSDGQTLSNKLRYYGFSFNTVDEITVTNNSMLIISTAYFLRSECGRVGIVAFRGTDPGNVINWLTDTDVTYRAFTHGQVHAGFYANTEAIWDEIATKLAAAIREEQPAEAQPSSGNGTSNGERERERTSNGEPRTRKREPMKVLYLTGHSLGGAMAVMAAANIFTNQYPVPSKLVRGIYTFGQPSVGDEVFTKHCDGLFGKRLFRHVFGFDVVPRLPPRSSGVFPHFGEERVAPKVGDPWNTLSQITTKQCNLALAAAALTLASFAVRRLPGILPQLPLRYSLDDHSPSRYILTSRLSLARH